VLIVTALPQLHFSCELDGNEGRKEGKKERMGERNITVTAENAH
jgi:hypothetical protein